MAGGLGLGVHLTPRLSARAEWALTGRLEDHSDGALNVWPGVGLRWTF